MSNVCLLENFCPICFRGKHLKVARVLHNSDRIDQEQYLCSKKTRGLPLLDLSKPGVRCSDGCRLVCLVCGNPMAFPCEPDYAEAFDAVEQFEEDQLETRCEVMADGFFQRLGQDLLASAELRLQRRVRPLGLAWHPRWHRLVHARCVKKEGCGCVLSIGLASCPLHIQKKALPAKRRAANMAAREEKEKAKTPAPKATPMRPVVITAATWLPKPSSTVSVALPCTAQHAPPPSRRPPPPRKPNPRLESAAKGCARIDDSWGKKRGGAGEHAGGTLAGVSFDPRRHQREFDPFLHGYFRKNGGECVMYRFPDGRVVPAPSGVNRLTEDGRLVPG